VDRRTERIVFRRCDIPAKSQAQQKFFGAVLGGTIPRPHGMTTKQAHDFAATPRTGLPRHLADGGIFVEREGVAPGTAHWMELIRAGTVPGKQMPSQRVPVDHMADGRRPAKYYGEGKWASEAFKPSHKGMLHRALHVPEGQKIPAGKMSSALHSDSPHVRHMAQAAKNI
jgi:hypothetical protein